jgi:hypothetical protein
MKKSILLFSMFLFIISSSRGSVEKKSIDIYNIESEEELYLELLEMFPNEQQGFGLEPRHKGYSHQPMTYGLVLSSECLHYQANPNEDSKERIRASISWLLSHIDDDQDGKPGWGLPHEWDAFSDGSENGKHHPYAITTAIVLEGISCAGKLENIWSENEQQNIYQAVFETIKYWTNSVYEDKEYYGYFWYSPSVNDKHFVINASAMMTGVIQQVFYHYPELFTKSEIDFIGNRIDLSVIGLIDQVEMRSGLPFWAYHAKPTQYAVRPNDLVHHTYIIWGIELYRQYGGIIEIPWTTQQALLSLDLFWDGGNLYEFPRVFEYSENIYSSKPARIWGGGMHQAFYSRWGNKEEAGNKFLLIVKDYGPSPNYSLYPKGYDEDLNFYPRFTSHLLLGYAHYFYGNYD